MIDSLGLRRYVTQYLDHRDFDSNFEQNPNILKEMKLQKKVNKKSAHRIVTWLQVSHFLKVFL